MVLLFSLVELTGFRAVLALLVLPLMAFGLGKWIWGAYKKKFYALQSQMKGFKTRTDALEKELKILYKKIMLAEQDMELVQIEKTKSNKEHELKIMAYKKEIISLKSDLSLLKEVSTKVKLEYEEQLTLLKQQVSDDISIETMRNKYEAEAEGFQSSIKSLETVWKEEVDELNAKYYALEEKYKGLMSV